MCFGWTAGVSPQPYSATAGVPQKEGALWGNPFRRRPFVSSRVPPLLLPTPSCIQYACLAGWFEYFYLAPPSPSLDKTSFLSTCRESHHLFTTTFWKTGESTSVSQNSTPRHPRSRRRTHVHVQRGLAAFLNRALLFTLILKHVFDRLVRYGTTASAFYLPAIASLCFVFWPTPKRRSR
jgi:hypothetical protein